MPGINAFVTAIWNSFRRAITRRPGRLIGAAATVALLLAVTLTTLLYSVPVQAQTPSTDVTLSALTVSPNDVIGFAANRISYEVGVASTVTEATVAATANHANATFVITPADADTSVAGHQVKLSAVENTVTVTVTAQDGNTTETDTVNISGVATETNTPATGAPTISGTAQVGQMLTASTSGIRDADGLANATFSYQWIHNDGIVDKAIETATQVTYDVQAGDANKTVKVRVSFTDDAGYRESVNSDPTGRIPAIWTGTVTVGNGPEGSGAVGYSTFAVGMGSVTDPAFQVDGVEYEVDAVAYDAHGLHLALSKELSTPFTLHVDTKGFESSKASTSEGSETYIHSWSQPGLNWSEGDNVRVVILEDKASNSAATGAPTISGTAQVGQMLTASSSGIRDADGLANAAFSYQWIRNDETSDTDISGADGSIHTLTDADEGKTIKVRVSFADDAGNAETLTSAATTTVEPQPLVPPAAPQNLTGSVSHKSVTLSWDDPGDDSITGYRMLRRSRDSAQYGDGQGAADFAAVVDDTGSSATTYTDTSVTPRTRYVYRIKAINQHGASQRSSYLNVETAASPAPAAPAGLSASSVAHDSVTIHWDDPEDDAITHYQILRREGGSGAFEIIAENVTETSYTDVAVAGETGYEYRVVAVNDAGASPESDSLTVNTPAAPSPPTKPTGLVATSALVERVDLSWDDPEDDTITHYQVLRREGDSGAFGTIQANTGPAATSYWDSTVAAETDYEYRVVALDDETFSPQSDSLKVSTPPAATSSALATRAVEIPSTVIIYSGTLTVGIHVSTEQQFTTDVVGFSLTPPKGALDQMTFSWRGVDYNITELAVERVTRTVGMETFDLGTSLAIELGGKLPEDVTLYLDDTAFPIRDSVNPLNRRSGHSWDVDSLPSWTDKQSVQARLEAPRSLQHFERVWTAVLYPGRSDAGDFPYQGWGSPQGADIGNISSATVDTDRWGCHGYRDENNITVFDCTATFTGIYYITDSYGTHLVIRLGRDIPGQWILEIGGRRYRVIDSLDFRGGPYTYLYLDFPVGPNMRIWRNVEDPGDLTDADDGIEVSLFRWIPPHVRPIPEYWSGQITPVTVDNGPSGYCGPSSETSSRCIVDSTHERYGSLTDDDFNIRGYTKTTLALTFDSSAANPGLHLTLNRAIQWAYLPLLELRIDEHTFQFAHASKTSRTPEGSVTYTWSSAATPWTVGTTATAKVQGNGE